MPAKIQSLIGSGLIALVLLGCSIILKEPDGLMFQAGILFAGAFLPLMIESYISYHGLIKIMVKSLFIRRMRISFAYLIRVKIDKDYLLVKSKRFDLFQPPGGVFEYYNDIIIDDLGLMNDESLKKVSKKDLRKTVTNPRNLAKIVTWFNSRTDREISPHREFIEELLDTNILDPLKFKMLDFKYLKTYNAGISYSEHFKCDELRIFEIFELIPSDKQIKELLKLVTMSHSDTFKILSKESINRDGFCTTTNQTVNLGTQTKYII